MRVLLDKPMKLHIVKLHYIFCMPINALLYNERFYRRKFDFRIQSKSKSRIRLILIIVILDFKKELLLEFSRTVHF
jgi:hypothetical protein